MTRSLSYKNITLQEGGDVETGGQFSLRFSARADGDAPLLGGHFPGAPVVPGVCTMILVRDCLEIAVGRKLRYSAVDSCKFMRPVVPDPDQILSIGIDVDPNAEELRIDCRVTVQDGTVLKLRGRLQYQ